MVSKRFALWLCAFVAFSIGGLSVGVRAEDAPGSAPMPPADPANAMTGTWEFSNADHDRICRFTFRPENGPGGFRVDLEKTCAGLFPTTKDVVGWSLDTFGTLRLLDKSGNGVIELTQAEDGIFDGFQPGEGRYVLQSAAAAPVRSADDLVGDWAITRGTGKPICVLTFVNNPAGTGNLSLTVKPGCDAFVTRFAPASWRVAQGELILQSARGQIWRFEEDDADTWLRVPESADPVLLVRQQ
jgi:Protease inhibitor Inh